MKRTLSLILAALFLLPIATFGGCAAEETGTNAAAETTVVEQVETKAADALEERQNVSDDLADDLDFGGQSFTMIVQTDHENDAWVPEMTGELVDDEIYMRNSRVSERLNIVIEPAVSISSYNDIATMITSSVLAGDGAYDLALQHAVMSGSSALKGEFIDWYTIPNLNFEKPWYPQASIKDLTILGQMYISVSDLCLSLTKNTYCMFFDKVKAAEFGYDNVYDIVNEGKWTLDTMFNMTKDIYVDLDGDGAADTDDYYGFGTDTNSNVITYLWSCDGSIVNVTDEPSIEVTFNSEKNADIVTRICDFLFNNVGTLYKAEHRWGLTYFAKGQVLFCNGLIGFSQTYLSEYENDFGIIPYPKYDEAQTNYHTMVDGNFSIIAVPKGVSNEKLAMIGATVEALSADSWKNVVPKYYDIALKVRYARDQESVAMLDTILEGRVVDFAYLYDNWSGFALTTQDIVKDNKPFSSTVEKLMKSKTKYYESVLKLFTGE